MSCLAPIYSLAMPCTPHLHATTVCHVLQLAKAGTPPALPVVGWGQARDRKIIIGLLSSTFDLQKQLERSPTTLFQGTKSFKTGRGTRRWGTAGSLLWQCSLTTSPQHSMPIKLNTHNKLNQAHQDQQHASPTQVHRHQQEQHLRVHLLIQRNYQPMLLLALTHHPPKANFLCQLPTFPPQKHLFVNSLIPTKHPPSMNSKNSTTRNTHIPHTFLPNNDRWV